MWFFSDDVSITALKLANNDVPTAIEIATTCKLRVRASRGEFGTAEVAVGVVDDELRRLESVCDQHANGTVLKDDQQVIDEIQPMFDTQIDPGLHSHLISRAKMDNTVTAIPSSDGQHIDTMPTLTYTVDDIEIPDASETSRSAHGNADWSEFLSGVEASHAYPNMSKHTCLQIIYTLHAILSYGTVRCFSCVIPCSPSPGAPAQRGSIWI